MRRATRISFLSFISALALLAPLPALAQASVDPSVYAKAAEVLVVLLVVAILVENALAVIFNWRVFSTYFSTRGVKTIVAVIVSFIVVRAFSIDGISDLIAAYRKTEMGQVDPAGMALTTLVIAGGSGAVYSIMRALGFRPPPRQVVSDKPAPEGKAWISLRIKPKDAVGRVQVHITEDADQANKPAAIAGTIGGRLPTLKELLTRNADRFPQSGGYELEPGKVYTIGIEAYDEAGNLLPDPFQGRRFCFANRAIVDFEESV